MQYAAAYNLRLFCLTSPVSFSCGSLVPWAFREDGHTLIKAVPRRSVYRRGTFVMCSGNCSTGHYRFPGKVPRKLPS